MLINTLKSPSLEIFQPCLDAVLCSLLWVTLLGQGVGLGDPRGPLQPLPWWDSGILKPGAGQGEPERPARAGRRTALPRQS